jgi:hypothetical protein
MTENDSKPNDNAKPASSEATKEVAFFPLKLAEEDTEGLDEKERVGDENDQKMQELLRSINEASTQLGGYLMEENKLMVDLCTSLAQVLKKLNIIFNIPPQNLPLQKKAKKAVLNEEGHLNLFYEKEERHSAFLAEYSPEIVVAVLWVVMPELAKAITLYRKKISARVSFFERVKKELRDVVGSIVGNSTGNIDSKEGQKQDTAQEIPKVEKQS